MKKTKTHTARFLAVLTAAVLLTGCGTKEKVDYYNYTGNDGYRYFTLGDVIYRCGFSTVPKQYHSGFDTPLIGLCRDPLCTHDDQDAVCPDQESAYLRFYCTDGEKIYASYKFPIKGTSDRFIYSMNPDGSDIQLLADMVSIQNTSRSSDALRVHDGYIYYHQSMYDDVTGAETIALMRVSVNGGKQEEVLGKRYQPGAQYYVDDEYYYVLDVTPYYSYEQAMILVNRETGETTENVRPEGYGVESVHTYRNETYIICAEGVPETDYETITEQTSLRAYRFRNGEFELIAENFVSYTFADGGFWYHPFEIEHYGTVMSPTGKGSETAPADIIRNTNNMLTRVDLADGSTKTWAFDRFDEGYVPMLYGISDGVAIVSMSSPKLRYENNKAIGSVHKYQLNDDGTVTDLGEFAS